MLKMSVTPEMAPDKPEYVELGFEQGVPVSLNGQKMKGTDLIAVLNVIAGRHGVGILDMVENRVVGMKSRGVYETPAGTVIMEAHANGWNSCAWTGRLCPSRTSLPSAMRNCCTKASGSAPSWTA
jgi:argininosuccinate synthase